MGLPPTESSFRLFSLSSGTRSVVLVPVRIGPLVLECPSSRFATMPDFRRAGSAVESVAWNIEPAAEHHYCAAACNSFAISSSRRDCSRSRITDAIPIAASVTNTMSVRRLYRNQRRRRGMRGCRLGHVFNPVREPSLDDRTKRQVLLKRFDLRIADRSSNETKLS